MKKRIIATFALIILMAGISYGASLHSLNKEAVTHIFVGKTFVSVDTDNLNGKTINNTFSMYLAKNGTILGTMSHKPRNEPLNDQGHYVINANGSMTITWNHWDGHKHLCADYYNTKNAFLAIGCDGIFHTAFMKHLIRQGDHHE